MQYGLPSSSNNFEPASLAKFDRGVVAAKVLESHNFLRSCNWTEGGKTHY